MSRTRWVLHVDLDQFIAAVEVLRHPELRGRPVVVGGAGDPTQRGVVATASYEARAHGVASGMPLRTAAKRCPDAVFLPSDPPAYDQVSGQVMETLRSFPAVVEVLGWDEAFLEIHTAEAVEPEDAAREIQHAVHEATELSCSVGIGDNKLRAKLATGFGKPAGMFRLTEQNWYPVMAERPTDALWGVGPKTARKLADLSIRTVADLALSDPRFLAERFGPKVGPWLRMLSRGVDRSPVVGTPYVPRSHGRETTFQANLTDWDAVRTEIGRLARRVAEEVLAEGRAVVRVGVKVRFAPFRTTTASVPLETPGSEPLPQAAVQDPGGGPPARTDAALELPAALEAAALAALAKVELREQGAGHPRRPVRLLGVRADFAPATTPS